MNVPLYVKVIFALTTFVTVFIFYKAAHNSRTVLVVLLSWILIQGLIALSGFYTDTYALPPSFVLLPLPPLLAIIFLFVTKKGRLFIDGLGIKALTILHAVRVPVEIVLYLLFVYKAVPGIMTFEGRNFDILTGLTAPAIYYYGFVTRQLSRQTIIAWNFICMGLLFNIVLHAIFSAPFVFQQMAFDQPNIAVFYFPFVWLPCCIVPLALLSHLAAIRQLTRKPKEIIP